MPRYIFTPFKSKSGLWVRFPSSIMTFNRLQSMENRCYSASLILLKFTSLLIFFAKHFTLHFIGCMQKQWAAVITNLKMIRNDIMCYSALKVLYLSYQRKVFQLKISTYLWFNNAPPHTPPPTNIIASHGLSSGS